MYYLQASPASEIAKSWTIFNLTIEVENSPHVVTKLPEPSLTFWPDSRYFTMRQLKRLVDVLSGLKPVKIAEMVDADYSYLTTPKCFMTYTDKVMKITYCLTAVECSYGVEIHHMEIKDSANQMTAIRTRILTGLRRKSTETYMELFHAFWLD
jgi:hypothetical protein